MPRILRNYIISFGIIGALLVVLHFADKHYKAHKDKQQQESSQQIESTPEAKY